MFVANRRHLILGAGAVAAAAHAGPVWAQAAAPAPDLAARLTYPFALPPLPYANDANEPSIDAMTMQLHHDRHHAAYVNNLNAALKDHADLQAMPLQDLLAKVGTLPEAIRTTVRNSGGGHANHTMFWQIMGGKGGDPTGDLGAAVARDFGSFAAFKDTVNKAAAGVFGSGWAMVTADREGKLSVVAKPNQDSPLMDGSRVLLGNDVWEHAYYLKYQNRRPEYLAAWWSVLDWERIGQRYAAAKAGTLTI